MWNTDTLKRWPGRALWRTPWPFGMARVLSTGYALRCVLFHDIAGQTPSFTNGLGVTMTPQAFEETLRFLVRHYRPVSLGEALSLRDGSTPGGRPVLVTFDDAYASVAECAAPFCREYGVPAVFFVNARFVDNRDIALDNLVCHLINTRGYEAVNAIVSEVTASAVHATSLRTLFGDVIPTLTLTRRDELVNLLAAAAGGSRGDVAEHAQLYLTARQLRDLTAAGFEIGNHTYSHVHGRILADSEFGEEIDRNRVLLESMTGTAIRSFSVPYGSSTDLTPRLAGHLQQCGYDAVFLVERLMNTVGAAARGIHRVSLQPGSDAELFSELEVLPRLRALRNALVHQPAARTS